MASTPKAPLTRKSGLGVFFAAGALVTVLACCFRWHVAFVGGRSCPAAAHRNLGVSRGAVDNALKNRIASVKNTGKLTDAMRLVAAAKVRRAQDGVAASRPFSNELQAMIKGLVKKLKGSGLEAELPMMRAPEKVKSVGILMITSNRGMCGGYNSFLCKKLINRTQELNSKGIKPIVVIVGKRGNNMAPRRMEGKGFDVEFGSDEFSLPDTLNSSTATEIADSVKNRFLAGEVDTVEVIYTKFINMLTFEPTIRTLLPLTPTGIENSEDETWKLTSEDGKLAVEKKKKEPVKAKNIESDVIFDQAPEKILNSMLPLYLTSQVLALMYESQASELASRMNAMKAATDNAAEVARTLTIIYNKKRQAAITAEICEISAGAAAVDEANENKQKELQPSETVESLTEEFMKEIDGEEAMPDEPVNPMEFITDSEYQEIQLEAKALAGGRR